MKKSEPIDILTGLLLGNRGSLRVREAHSKKGAVKQENR
jgi:hypothetical protein